jgi:hypothetical protein
VVTDPEELLRSIERTREELANTVDTIAGRLDPKRAAKRGVSAVRERVTGVFEGARAKSASGLPGSLKSGPLGQVPGLVKRVPKPAAGGLAALVALAAIMAARRRRR